MGRMYTEQEVTDGGSTITITRVPEKKPWWQFFGGSDPSDASPKHKIDEATKLFDTDGNECTPSLPDEEVETKQSGVFASMFNLCNVCLGAGTLSMPFAFKNVGIALGLVLLTMIYSLMVVSGIMITDAARKVNPDQHNISYGGIVRAAFGPKGTVLVQFIIIVACSGIAIAYFQLVGDLLSPPIGYWLGDDPEAYCSWWAKRSTPMLFALGIEAALCVMPSFTALRYVSFVAVASMIYLTVIVVIRSGQRWDVGPEDGDELLTFHIAASMFRTISILTFAFAPHIQIVSMFGEFKNPTRPRVRQWIWGSLTIAWAVYALVGSFGYYAFYGETKGNILLNHDPDDVAVLVGRLGVAVSVLAGYPTMCAPTVASLDKIFFPDREPSLWGRRLLLVAVFLAFTWMIAYLIDDVSIILGLTGAGGLTFAAFLIPAACYISLFREEHGLFGGLLTKWSWVTLFLGSIFGGVAIVVNLIDAIEGEDNEPCTWPNITTCAPQRCCPPGGVYGEPTLPCPTGNISFFFSG
eukprot:TRINITY_DN8339_c0_g2_i1.p1 TRINITY_DN8339_c0_g2~~TRINITY_DN8339_c0_g2_i1.p1  ORF type:complete len:530 (+),score=82.48 TRINITY_DN8339_c0_g2_i1:23-1591(+)